MNKNYQEAAVQLLKNRKARVTITPLSEQNSPNNCDQAFQIHQEMIALRTDGVAGWKCLLPLSDEKLIAAPIFADTLQSGSHCALFSDNNKVRIEPEIAFVLGIDLPAQDKDYNEDEIDNAVASCHMALELMQARFSEHPDVSFFERLADGMVNQGLYLGPEIEKSKAYAASEINIIVKQPDDNQKFEGVA